MMINDSDFEFGHCDKVQTNLHVINYLGSLLYKGDAAEFIF